MLNIDVGTVNIIMWCGYEGQFPCVYLRALISEGHFLKVIFCETLTFRGSLSAMLVFLGPILEQPI